MKSMLEIGRTYKHCVRIILAVKLFVVPGKPETYPLSFVECISIFPAFAPEIGDGGKFKIQFFCQ
jgi:hypothetical protein